MRRLGYRTVDLLVEELTDLERPPLRRATPAEMRTLLGGPAPEGPPGGPVGGGAARSGAAAAGARDARRDAHPAGRSGARGAGGLRRPARAAAHGRARLHGALLPPRLLRLRAVQRHLAGGAG